MKHIRTIWWLSLLLAVGSALTPSDVLGQDVGTGPRTDQIFNGEDLVGWSAGDARLWSVENGVIVGQTKERLTRNEFIWSSVEVSDFYLSVDVLLSPEARNAGIQFRSRPRPPHEAKGYQADIGKGVWGRLFYESGRGKLDWRDRGERVVKPGEWNRYEILAVGHRIWTAVNGQLSVSLYDPEGDLTGLVALQIHSGQPLTVKYKINKLIHNPKIELAGLTEQQLDDELITYESPAKKRASTQGTTSSAPSRPPIKPQPATRFYDPRPAMERFAETPRPSVATLGVPFVDGRFDLASGDVVVFAGQTNMVRAQQAGDLESLLAVAYASRRPLFRSMAWETDTVYRQWRDANFGGWHEQLTWVGADVVVCQFGQIESMDGMAKLTDFIAAYGRLIDAFSAVTPRIVLVSPMPFEGPATPFAPELSAKNSDVRAYADAIRELAASRGCIYVDLVTPLSKGRGAQPLTVNGMHLTAHGQGVVARLVASQLGTSIVLEADLDAVRQAVVEKNRMWFDNWRPMNWAFAYGDRQWVPFPRPAGDQPAMRIELAEFKPLVAAADDAVHTRAAEAAGRATRSSDVLRKAIP